MTKIKYLVVLIFFSFATNIYAIDDIKINNETLSPLFGKNIYVYNYFTIKDEVIITVSKSINETVKGYGYFKLEKDKNEFIIESKIDNETKKYKINVFKNYNSNDDSVATFKSLTIEGYNINFNNDVYEYEIAIDDESCLDINYELDSLSSKVIIENNGGFINGNNDVVVNITSKDNTVSNKYTFHVLKTVKTFKSNEKVRELSHISKQWVKIIIVLISSAIIVLSYFLLFTKRIIKI